MASLKKTARLAGLAYLGLGITGMLGFLVARNQIIVDGDAAATLANLQESPGVASAAVALMLGVSTAQALAAVGFWALFRTARPVAAVAVAAFGMANAIIVLVGAAFASVAVAIGTGHGSAIGGDTAGTVHALYELETAAWSVGSVFFGLWLIPMGIAAMRSGYFHAGRVLGWILIAGGLGYLASAVIGSWPSAPSALVETLPIPATVGEFWMIGALLAVGVRRGADGAPAQADPDTAPRARAAR